MREPRPTHLAAPTLSHRRAAVVCILTGSNDHLVRVLVFILACRMLHHCRHGDSASYLVVLAPSPLHCYLGEPNDVAMQT